MGIPVESYELPNGLKVNLSEDHSVPIVAVNLWYHVGSANEKAGRTGFAHLFEHMLFQGSANVGVNEHFELIQRAGGTLNGSTWLERTNYYETVPSNHLGIALWLEADRMAALLPAMTQEKLDTQRDVVKNERRWTVDNQPYGTMLEKLQEISFEPDHPFHHSLIGSMDDLTNASLDDVAEFFSTFYVPNNAVLTVCGDFEPAEARALVSEYFGPIPRGTFPINRPAMEVPALFGSGLHETVEDQVGLPRLFTVFRTPVFGTDGYYTASVCAAILGLRKGSRLYKRLVRGSRKASEVSAYTFDLAKASDLLVLDVTANTGISGDEIIAEVHQEVDRLRNEGISQGELDRAQTVIETEIVRALETAGERADRLSMFTTYFGDAALLNEQVSRYRQVTVDDIQKFADDYLTENNCRSLLYVPADSSGVFEGIS